jgi:hypothetical protein
VSAVQTQCADALATAIAALSLTGISSGEIVVRRKPTRADQFYRGITLFPLEENEAPGTNQREDIGYAIGVLLCRESEFGNADNMDVFPTWRESIRRNVIHKRITVTLSGGHYLTTTWEPGRFNVPKQDRFETSQFTIRCWMREPRT